MLFCVLYVLIFEQNKRGRENKTDVRIFVIQISQKIYLEEIEYKLCIDY